MTENPEPEIVRPIPDHVAIVLGRFMYYAAWLDDVLGDVVVHGNWNVTADSSSTPGWAASGDALVTALRNLPEPKIGVIGFLADRLERNNPVRNQLVHGAWLCEPDKVVVVKRSMTKGERQSGHVTYTYAGIQALTAEYQMLITTANKVVTLLMKDNPASKRLEELNTPNCPDDLSPMVAGIRDETIIWRCPKCGFVKLH
jgi:hypothetical protein